METDHLDDDTVQALAEGTLEPDARGPAEAHLAGCSACMDEVAAYRAIFAVLEEPVPAAPPDLAVGIEAAIRREGRVRPARTRPGWKTAALAAAAAALFVALGALVAHETGLSLVPELTARLGEQVESVTALPAGVDEAAETAAGWAETGWTKAASRAERLLESRASLQAPLLVAVVLFGMLNLAALWKLRRVAL